MQELSYCGLYLLWALDFINNDFSLGFGYFVGQLISF